MRIALISDMHGNNFAFEKVLADIKQQGADQLVCLGDANELIDIYRQSGRPFAKDAIAQYQT